MTDAQPVLEVLLPVHNEGDSIERTVREIHDELSPQVPLRFIICEDGSVDDTREVLTRLSQSLPMKLIMSEARKGYSRAVVDGMKQLEAPYLLCLDSDGQCDPKDFWKFWEARDTADVVIGWRVNRADNFMRRTMSRFFYYVYQMFYRTPVHDPSCSFVLISGKVADAIAPKMGQMQQGFWWEFVARVHGCRFNLHEIPINHRLRSAGETQVYHLRKLPGIGWRHFVALFRIWAQIRSHNRQLAAAEPGAA